MLDLHPQYLLDERGNRLVVLTEEEFESLLAWTKLQEPDPFRPGEYRAVYQVDRSPERITIHRIRHRREVYE